MLADQWLHLAFLSMALEDACCPMIASCFSFYGTWRCLQTGDCILFFLSMAIEDACCLVSVSCFSFYGTWGCLPPDDCILFFFLWHLKLLAAWWLHLVFLSMALEDACCLVIVSCFSFYGTWGCLQLGDCILLFFLWHLKMLAARWLHLVFLSMTLEDACCLISVSLSCFLCKLKILPYKYLHLQFAFLWSVDTFLSQISSS